MTILGVHFTVLQVIGTAIALPIALWLIRAFIVFFLIVAGA